MGATSIGSDSAGAVSAASLVPQVEWSRGTLYGLLNGGISVFEGATWAAQAWGNFSFLSRDARQSHAVRFESTASLGGSVHGDRYGNLSSQADVRVHFSNRTIGGWLGLSAALGLTTDSVGGATAVGPTAGGWLSHRRVTATAFWSAQVVQGDWFHELNVRVFGARGPVDVMVALWNEPTRPSARVPPPSIGRTKSAGSSVETKVPKKGLTIFKRSSELLDIDNVIVVGSFPGFVMTEFSQPTKIKMSVGLD